MLRIHPAVRAWEYKFRRQIAGTGLDVLQSIARKSPMSRLVPMALSQAAFRVHDCYCGPESNENLGHLPVASGEVGTAHSTMYERIEVTCECGHQPTRLREVGLTVDRQLVIYWRCSHCRRQVYRVKPLAECLRECPVPAPASEAGINSAIPQAKAS